MHLSIASVYLALALLLHIRSCIWAQQCGSQAGDALCANNLCCSQYGYCGTTDDYCGSGCQSGCPNGNTSSPSPSTPSESGSVSDIITSSIFDEFLSQRTASGCPSNGFYTYDAFVSAAASQSGFGTTGSSTTAKQELAAFFANIAHETGSGCYVEEIEKDTYCDATSVQWPCNPDKQYYGRGPIQLSWNFNYGPAGQALGFDGINNPETVAEDPKISFETALWYWMTQGSPSAHEVMVNGNGFGATIQAINGALECGSGANVAQQQSRISLYQNFTAVLDVETGEDLTC